MTLTIKVGDLQVLTTSITPTAHVTVSFSGSRWFGFSVAIAYKDANGQTASVTQIS